ncbi:YqhV family protein [Peribacillus sp. SCS-155]|uniref:YqhV family protein n=1 Tax=Peribacillus sedimenti TaxID=3115297 RepID=UPI00390675E8
MFIVLEKAVLLMALLRFISGSIEISAALLMIKLNDVEKALLVNSSLALVGPIVLILTTTIGLLGISEKLSFSKLAFIFTGVALILIGIRK